MRREPNSFFNSNHLYVGTSLFIWCMKSWIIFFSNHRASFDKKIYSIHAIRKEIDNLYLSHKDRVRVFRIWLSHSWAVWITNQTRAIISRSYIGFHHHLICSLIQIEYKNVQLDTCANWLIQSTRLNNFFYLPLWKLTPGIDE